MLVTTGGLHVGMCVGQIETLIEPRISYALYTNSEGDITATRLFQLAKTTVAAQDTELQRIILVGDEAAAPLTVFFSHRRYLHWLRGRKETKPRISPIGEFLRLGSIEGTKVKNVQGAISIDPERNGPFQIRLDGALFHLIQLEPVRMKQDPRPLTFFFRIDGSIDMQKGQNLCSYLRAQMPHLRFHLLIREDNWFGSSGAFPYRTLFDDNSEAPPSSYLKDRVSLSCFPSANSCECSRSVGIE